MIPYEDLVIALQTWRAKQGLPVAQLSGALVPPPAVAPAAPMTTPPGPPPKAQQGFLGNVATPPPLAANEDSMDVDDAALIEETHYENEGDDYAMALGGAQPVQDDEDSTSIGHQPPPLGRPSEMTLDEGTEVAAEDGSRPTKRNEDW